MPWEFHNVQFSMDLTADLPQDYMQNGSWSGHRRFAYDLVRSAKPQKIVELGTCYGSSFFSFCQAVRDGHFPAKCFAVDTWKGDPHIGYYGEEVFGAVNAFNAKEFAGIGELLRCDFDHALSLFQNNSINLLHIDGYHTYEAVSHDYQNWYPKLADFGIVLFHDISVRHSDFGVYRLWEQLRHFPHIEFFHSFGLGVLFPKGVPHSLQSALANKQAIVSLYSL